MSTVAGAPACSQAAGRDSLGELRRDAIRIIAFVVTVLAFLRLLISGIWLPQSLWEPLPTVVGLLATTAITIAALRFGPAIATWSMALSLAATLSVLILISPREIFPLYYCLIVLVVTGILGPLAGLVAATFTSLVALLLNQLLAGVTTPVTLVALSLIWLVFPLTWMLTRPLRITLEWAWASYTLAEEKTEEARASRAELVQLSKSLVEACDRLESVNVQLEEMRRQAESARRLKAEFAATVGHELRTPVNLIIGFAEMIIAGHRSAYYDEPLPASYRDDVQVIYRNACHISTLVDDILDLSQVDAQRMALHRQWTSLATVVREAVGNVDALYIDAGLAIQIDLPDALPAIPVDPIRIRQVLVNLLYNAARFTQQGGVRINAHTADADVIVTVEDSGSGIAADDLPRLFEEFRQFGPSPVHRKGSGLGLAVCKRFIELHGGSIWAESVVGRGTAIAFSLPIHENVATAALERIPPLHLVRPENRNAIAIVDPGEVTARILRRYLDGYSVYSVSSPEDAARLARTRAIRAVVLTSLADQPRWEEQQGRIPRLQDVPTILCPLRTVETMAEKIGALEYLVKPVTRDQLARALRRAPRSRRVAVIEDDPDMRDLLVRTVASLPGRHHVVEAENGSIGLQLLRQAPPDVVVLDLLMPEMDGYALVDTMRRDPALQQIPVIVVSARGADERVSGALVGVSQYGGLSAGEVVTFLKADLDALVRLKTPWLGTDGDEMAPERRGASPD